MKENQQRHNDNLSIFTGYLGGKYYDNGTYRPPKDKQPLPMQGDIFVAEQAYLMRRTMMRNPRTGRR